MADYIVQDTQLTTVADAIRAKGGTSEKLAFPEGFVSAVEGISAGGGGDPETMVFDGLRILSISPALSIERVVVKGDYINANADLSRLAVSGANEGSVNHQFKHLTLEADAMVEVSVLSCRNGFNGLSLLESVTLKNIRPSVFYQGFQCVYGENSTSLKSVCGLDFTRCGGSTYRIGNMFGRQAKLENVTLVPNTCGKLVLADYAGNTLSFSECPMLMDASLVSIANGLCATNVSTLELHTTKKARCNEITGTVSTMTDDDGEYQFFTQDDAGTVTLTEFITVTKGWTLA